MQRQSEALDVLNVTKRAVVTQLEANRNKSRQLRKARRM